MRTCVRVCVVCVLLPRFPLIIAAGGRRELAGRPAALAPQPGREQLIGEVSAAADTHGVRPGMRLGEALARCPTLMLVPPDPVGVADHWETVLRRLESIGAAVESGEPGVAYFDARPLARLYGHRISGPAFAGPMWLAGVVDACRDALRVPARVGAGPSRFCALVAATRARQRHPHVIDGAVGLADGPIDLLRHRPEVAHLIEPLERLGIATLGGLAALPAAAVADRFGTRGLSARELALGRDTALQPRDVHETLEEALELPEAGDGPQLHIALEMLVDRVLAHPRRQGRALRVVILAARMVSRGTWRERVVFREPLAERRRILLALDGRLDLVPAPAETLRLIVERFGPAQAVGGRLFADRAQRQPDRLKRAVEQARAVAGPYAILRIRIVEPDSRIPERRITLTPFE